MPDVAVDVAHPERELTEAEREHLGLPAEPSVATATVTHPDRPLTPEERAHLGMPPADLPEEE